jgi:hypothetical protein
MTYRVLPDPRDIDAVETNLVIEWCRANGIDATRIPAPQGDPGFGLQIHGNTIRYREYLMDVDGKVVVDGKDRPRLTSWGERPLIAPPEKFGIRMRKVRA